jgi:hypothetical protein
MAFVHGKTSKFSIDNVSGTPVDISAFCDDVSFSRNLDTAEVSTFGNSAKEYLIGLSDATLSISGKFDAAGASTIDAVLSGILGHTATSSFEYVPGGGTVGANNPAYRGECWLTSYDVSGAIGDAVSFSADFQVSGPITRAVS